MNGSVISGAPEVMGLHDFILKSIKDMVLEFKDEPYVLVWLLGNENVYGLGCNADKKPKSFFSPQKTMLLSLRLIVSHQKIIRKKLSSTATSYESNITMP